MGEAGREPRLRIYSSRIPRRRHEMRAHWSAFTAELIIDCKHRRNGKARGQTPRTDDIMERLPRNVLSPSARRRQQLSDARQKARTHLPTNANTQGK